MIPRINGHIPQIYNLEVLVEKVSIFEGDHQNVNPTARSLQGAAEDTANVQPAEPTRTTTTNFSLAKTKKPKPGKGKGKKGGKNKGGNKGKAGGKKAGKKGKKKGGKKGGKKSGNITFNLPTPPPYIPPQPPYKLLPPLSLGVRLLGNKPFFVEQIDLPPNLPPPPVVRDNEETVVQTQKPVLGVQEAAEIYRESVKVERKKVSHGGKEVAKGGKGKNKKGKGKNVKGKKGKKGGKKKKKSKKESAVKVTEPAPPPPQPVPVYTEEELLWKLPDEERFGRGISITTCLTADDMIMWLQRGYFRIEVCRWSGRQDRESVSYCNFCILPRYSETALSALNKENDLPLVVGSEGELAIRELKTNKEIGSLHASFNLTCFGGVWMSEGILSQCGLLEVLRTCPAEKNPVLEEELKELRTKRHIGQLLQVIKDEATWNRPYLPPVTVEDIMTALC